MLSVVFLSFFFLLFQLFYINNHLITLRRFNSPVTDNIFYGTTIDDDSNFTEKFLVFYLYERPYEKDEAEEFSWLQILSFKVASISSKFFSA